MAYERVTVIGGGLAGSEVRLSVGGPWRRR